MPSSLKSSLHGIYHIGSLRTGAQWTKFMAGQIKVPNGIDTMFQSEIESMFYGSE
jgi:hypothetical protein